MVGSYLDSPIYRQMLAQTMQGGPSSQYPGQAMANGLAQALQAHSLKKFGDKQEAKQQAGNADLAKALLPEQFRNAGGGQAYDAALSGGGSISGNLPNIQDGNVDKRSQLAALLNGGVIDAQSLAPMALQSLGLGGTQGPIKLGKDEGLYDPTTYAPLIKPRQAPVSLGRDSRLLNPETGDEIAGMAPPEVDYNKAFLPDGTPNTAFQDYEINRQKAGRASTTVNVGAEKPFSQALGTGAANILESSSAAARGGAQTLGTVSQIRQALNTNKVMAGPGTTAAQFFSQISGGDPQRLQATRATMQGLAKLTLDARGAMKGQGTITDREQQLLERAVSGDIDSLTIPEIRTMTDVAERAARAAIKANTDNVERARQVPGSGAVVDFFAVPEPSQGQPQGGTEPRVLRFNPATGRLE